MNANITAIVFSLLRHLEGHRFGATTLLVLDDGATCRARRSMLADGSIGHGEDEVEIGII